MTFDPEHRPGRATRRFVRRVPELVETARHTLVEEIDGILVTDSLRFVDVLGPSAPPGLLAELTEDGT